MMTGGLILKINFSDGYDLWYFNELMGEGQFIDIVRKESIDDLKYLLFPFLEGGRNEGQ